MMVYKFKKCNEMRYIFMFMQHEMDLEKLINNWKIYEMKKCIRDDDYK